MDYVAFLKAVERGQTPPVALLHGPEPFLLEEAVTHVTQALFPGETDLSLLRETLDARETDADAIVQAALMLPWISMRRLVVARAVDALSAKQGEALGGYLRTPNPSTVLLLLAASALPGSHWLTQAVPAAWNVSVAVPSGRPLTAWLCARARSDGFELGQDAADLLIELSGNDLTRLRGEVEKAALAGGPDNRRVGVSEVRAVVGEHRLRHVFDLTRAVTTRDAASALSVLELLLNAGEEPLGVLGMLVREVRAVWETAEALSRGRREEDIARILRRPPGAATAVIERARTTGPGTAARLIERCWEAERRIKLSTPPRPELSLLVADLCAG